MAYDTKLADRVRTALSGYAGKKLTEKKMFGGLAFLVNGKMCINISGNNLMCRFDPALRPVVEGSKGYHPVIMKGRELKGYCYVAPEGFATKKDFESWLDICLDFNRKAKASKKTVLKP
jgi:hypothetical protein